MLPPANDRKYILGTVEEQSQRCSYYSTSGTPAPIVKIYARERQSAKL